MRYFIPDSVASETHEREIPDHIVAGLPLIQAIAVINAYDLYGIMGDEMFEEIPSLYSYSEVDGTGILEVETDNRGHWYGIVYNPTNPELARKLANEVEASW